MALDYNQYKNIIIITIQNATYFIMLKNTMNANKCKKEMLQEYVLKEMGLELPFESI